MRPGSFLTYPFVFTVPPAAPLSGEENRMGLSRVAINPNSDGVRHQRYPPYPVLLLLGAVVGLFFVFQHVEQLRELAAARAQNAEMRRIITLGHQNTLNLQAELRYATSDEYVVQMARGELGYIQDGDEVYILLNAPAGEVESLPTASPADAADDSFRPLDWNWWQSLLQRAQE